MERKRGLLDFHFHSCYSDGSEDISSIIIEAKKRNVVGLCLTDHNNNGGVSQFVAACKENDIFCFEGTEIYINFPDTSWSKLGCGKSPDAVILGRNLNWKKFIEYQKRLVDYWVDYWLPQTLEGLRSVGLAVPEMSRQDRYLQVWGGEKGIMIPRVLHDAPSDPENWEAILSVVKKKSPEITIEDISGSPVRYANKYLYGFGMPAYVLRVFSDWSVAAAADMANEMGGVLFAAHPGGDNGKHWTKRHLDYFVENGGKGIEPWHVYHSVEQSIKFLDYAKKRNLLVSGGSDWHGLNGVSKLGLWDKPDKQVPFWVLEKLKKELP